MKNSSPWYLREIKLSLLDGEDDHTVAKKIWFSLQVYHLDYCTSVEEEDLIIYYQVSTLYILYDIHAICCHLLNSIALVKCHQAK